MAAVARVFRGSLFLMSPAAGAAGTAAGAKKAGAAAAAATKKRTKAASTKPRTLTGITKPLPVSEEFRRFAGGAPEVARSEAVKLVWAHIKAHGLQDPAKKSEINCDATLKSLFGGRDRIGMMEISKLLGPHFLKN
ncbi:protein TRI1-like [Miscanthus floridulus]|uniref:protein TRI1-like n=1 Tax=Miscanthus floridulus TaxID=154761 RepID=UPI0034595DE0